MHFENVVPREWPRAGMIYKTLREKSGYEYLKLIGGTSEDGTHASIAVTFAIVKKPPKEILLDFLRTLCGSEKKPTKKILTLVTPFKPGRFNPKEIKQKNQYSSNLEDAFLTLQLKFSTTTGLKVVKAYPFKTIFEDRSHHTKYFYLVFKTEALENQKLVIDEDKHYPLWLPVQDMIEFGHKSHKEIFNKALDYIGQDPVIKAMLKDQLHIAKKIKNNKPLR